MENQQSSTVDFPPLPTPSLWKQSAAFLTSTGSPQRNTPEIGRSNAFDIFLEEESDIEPTTSIDEDIPTPEPALPTPTNFRLSEFLEMVSKSTITTDQLLVSFLPDWIQQDAFCKLMHNILSLLVADSTLQAAKTPVHQRPGFADFFTSKAPLWMDLYNPSEQHGSYFLGLPVPLTFSPSDRLLGLHPPRFFTVRIARSHFRNQAPSHLPVWLTGGDRVQPHALPHVDVHPRSVYSPPSTRDSVRSSPPRPQPHVPL